MKMIEKICKKKFERKPVPGGREICEVQLMDLIDKMKNVEIDEDQISAFELQIEQKLQDMSREEIIKKFVSMEFNRFIDYYRNAKDINVESDDERGGKKGRGEKGGRDNERGSRDRDRRERGRNYSRLFISLGSKDRVLPGMMMGFINRVVDNREVSIGKIDIMRNFSFFEVDTDHVQEVLDSMRNAQFDGMDVSVELADSKGPRGGKDDRAEHKPNRRERRAEKFKDVAKDYVRDYNSRDDRAFSSDRYGDRGNRRRDTDRKSRKEESKGNGRKDRNEIHRKGFRGK